MAPQCDNLSPEMDDAEVRFGSLTMWFTGDGYMISGPSGPFPADTGALMDALMDAATQFRSLRRTVEPNQRSNP